VLGLEIRTFVPTAGPFCALSTSAVSEHAGNHHTIPKLFSVALYRIGRGLVIAGIECRGEFCAQMSLPRHPPHVMEIPHGHVRNLCCNPFRSD